ncbi:MAG: hypothetical protein IPG97_16620 [Microthrixaceae bacterium]|nr:hypothetical protein [Microthrixaceae bacterium]
MSARYIIGDTRDVLATIPDGSIDLVMTSPPFLALRSYLPADHPDKHREIGSEPDPATFLDTLLLLTAEWGRVLAPHGSICVELGDTYSGSGGAGGDYNPDGLRDGQSKFEGSNQRRGKVVDHNSGRRNPPDTWPLPKSLCGIPHLYHLSLAYGRNLLTGEESPAGRWRVRNVVAWCRPNPPVGALGDKFRPATSYMTIATRAQKRYFDLDAVRTEHKHPDDASRARTGHRDAGKVGGDGASNPAGAPPLDYWVIPTAPYSGSHYAVYPPALCERPIKSMVPAKVCTVCGAPSERITSEPEYVSTTGGRVVNHFDGDRKGESVNAWEVDGGNPGHVVRSTTTIGWSECECPDDGTKWRNGVVLDPFAGSGTTLMVATGHGRDAIGIDIDARNADLALDRVGPLMLTVEHHPEEAAS